MKNIKLQLIKRAEVVLLAYSVRNIVRKSDGKDSINEDMSSICRVFSSCFNFLLSSTDIPFPRAAVLQDMVKVL